MLDFKSSKSYQNVSATREPHIGWGAQVPIEVKVVDAAEVIEDVKKRADGRRILAKFDCEGGEYEILPRLAKTGNLRALSAIVMEEHILPGQNREALVSVIRDAGFLIRRTEGVNDHLGMLVGGIGNSIASQVRGKSAHLRRVMR